MNKTGIFSNAKAFIAARWTIITLLIILIAGSWLRFDGATWGLPLRLHPDEKRIVDNAIDMANAHRYEVTGDFNHPNHTPIKMQVILFWGLRHTIQAVSILQLADDEVVAIIDQFEGIPDTIQKLPPKAQIFMLNCSNNHKISLGRANDNSFYVSAGRALSALFGVICIIFAWLIGKQINKNVGLLCALLFALFPDFIERSHSITPEIYQTAFTLAMTYFSILYLKNPKYKILFCACACAALAFCTKYSALFSFPIIITAIICANPYTKTEPIFKLIWKNMYTCIIAIIMFGVCVFAISPILLLDLPSVYVNVMYEARSTHLGADGFGYWNRLFFYLRCYVIHAGFIISASVLGLFLYKKEDKQILILLLIGVLYAPIIAILPLHWARWGVPFYAFALILSSIGIWKIIEWLKPVISEFMLRQVKVSKIKLILSFLIVILYFISLINIGVDSAAMTMRFAKALDTRNASLEYVSEIGATRDNTFYEGYTPFNPMSPATIFERFESGDVSKPGNPELKYIILSSSIYSRFYAEPDKYGEQIAFYDALKANYPVIREFKPVVVRRSANDILNIYYIINVIHGYINGGYSGPNLIFYQYQHQP